MSSTLSMTNMISLNTGGGGDDDERGNIGRICAKNHSGIFDTMLELQLGQIIEHCIIAGKKISVLVIS